MSSVIIAPMKMIIITSGVTNFHTIIQNIIIRGLTLFVVTLLKKLGSWVNEIEREGGRGRGVTM